MKKSRKLPLTKYRKKPVVIEAFQLTREARRTNEDWPQWLHMAWQMDLNQIGSVSPETPGTGNGPLVIHTLEGIMRCDFDDWIIKGIKGELYPCKPDVFAASYEPA